MLIHEVTLTLEERAIPEVILRLTLLPEGVGLGDIDTIARELLPLNIVQ